MNLSQRWRSGLPIATFTSHEGETTNATGTARRRLEWDRGRSALLKRPQRTLQFRFMRLILVLDGVISPVIQ